MLHPGSYTTQQREIKVSGWLGLKWGDYSGVCPNNHLSSGPRPSSFLPLQSLGHTCHHCLSPQSLSLLCVSGGPDIITGSLEEEGGGRREAEMAAWEQSGMTLLTWRRPQVNDPGSLQPPEGKDTGSLLGLPEGTHPTLPTP